MSREVEYAESDFHEKCPKCGGKSGWVRHVGLRGVRVEMGGWGQSESDVVETDGELHRMPETVRCADCKARFNAGIATPEA